MCLPWGQYILTILYDIIVSRTFYIVQSHHMSVWLMWPLNHAYVTCDIMFCLLCLYPNKEKDPQNKIKENKIKPSLLFTTLTPISQQRVQRLPQRVSWN